MEDRIKTAKRMLRFWERRLEELTSAFSVVNGVNVNAKRKEAGKENLPPTPPIREKGEEKKTTTTTTARARADSQDSMREARLAEVEAYRAETGSDIDPEVFVDYYLSNHRGWPKNWQARFRNKHGSCVRRHGSGLGKECFAQFNHTTCPLRRGIVAVGEFLRSFSLTTSVPPNGVSVSFRGQNGLGGFMRFGGRAGRATLPTGVVVRRGG